MQLIAEPDATTTGGSIDITLQWNTVTIGDGDAAQYYVEVDDSSAFAIPNYNSGWISGTTWVRSLPQGTWYWRVKAQDSVHTGAVSNYSSYDNFNITYTAP